MRTCTHIKIPLSSSYEYFEVHNNFNTLITDLSSQDGNLQVIHKRSYTWIYSSQVSSNTGQLKEVILGSIPPEFEE